MKPLLKTLVLCVALIVMNGCSAQRRAERLVRRAVALCPELVQVKAHPIDTVLTAPGFADMAAIPFRKVATGDTIYAATDHGTVVVSLRRSDSALRVGFVAAPQKVRYKDTVELPQVVIEPARKASGAFWSHLALALIGVGLGTALGWWLIYIARKNTTNKTTDK